jgi:hypothetical protein
MKSFTTVRFFFVMLLSTGLLISAFILFFRYLSDQELRENLLNNTSVNSDSSVEFISKTNSNHKLADAPADTNVKHLLQK